MVFVAVCVIVVLLFGFIAVDALLFDISYFCLFSLSFCCLMFYCYGFFVSLLICFLWLLFLVYILDLRFHETSGL